MLLLSGKLKNCGYREINLNLGCPYPMVTNRGKGAGLLPHPEKIKTIIGSFFEKTDMQLSVKLRAGLSSPVDFEKLIPVFNEFPLTEIIIHPRIASQLYKGETNDDAFCNFSKNCNHRLVYNGDIFSFERYKKKQARFADIKMWMLGRGILMNPFLPAEIKGIPIASEDKFSKLEQFHLRIFDLYSEKMDNSGNVLNKMRQFWTYFAFSFPAPSKTLRTIRKIKSPENYLKETGKIFETIRI